MGDLTLSAEADWPTHPISTPTLSLGPLGSFGLDFKVNPHFMLDLSSGEWELSAGNLSEAQHNAVEPDSHNLTLHLGQNTLQGDVRFGGSGTLSPTAGFTDTKVFVGLSLSDKFPLGEVGLVDLLGPGLSSLASDVPVVGGLVKSVSIQFYAKPEIGGDVYLHFPSFQFDSADFGGSIAITAEYEPDLGKLGKFKVYVGGTPSVLLQLPSQPPGGFLKEAEFEAYAGVEWEIWVFTFPVTFSGEYVFLEIKYPSDGARSLARQLKKQERLDAGSRIEPGAAAIRRTSQPSQRAGGIRGEGRREIRSSCWPPAFVVGQFPPHWPGARQRLSDGGIAREGRIRRAGL